MRLIDADKLKQHYAWWNDERKELFDTIVDIQPTVEPRETKPYFKNKENFAKVCRCKDCLYFEYKVGSYGICKHWHTNNQDIFDLNYCGYAEPRTPKERGGEK